MCFDEGILQAYSDRELDEKQVKLVEKHLESCDRCQKSLQKLLEIDLFVKSKMASGLQLDDIYLQRQWKNFNKKIQCNKKGGIFSMLNRYKRVLSTSVAIILLLSIIFVTPVRKAAADFLSIFRMSKFKTITFTQEDFKDIERQFREGGLKDIDLKQYGSLKVDGGGEPERFDPEDINILKEKVDIPVISPKVPEGFKLEELLLQKASNFEITPSVENLNGLIATLGGNHMFPMELDNKTFKIITKDCLLLYYSKGSENLTIGMMDAPEIQVPGGVKIQEVRRAVISLPFIPENIRKQLADIKDFENTIPIPVGDEGVKEVNINGYLGILYDLSPGYSSLMWSDGKYLYNVAGEISEAKMLDVARSLR